MTLLIIGVLIELIGLIDTWTTRYSNTLSYYYGIICQAFSLMVIVGGSCLVIIPKNYTNISFLLIMGAISVITVIISLAKLYYGTSCHNNKLISLHNLYKWLVINALGDIGIAVFIIAPITAYYV